MRTSRIQVHMHNTGQVLACCGLLLLADLVSRRGQPAEAWFGDGTFCLAADCPGPVQDPLECVLRELAHCTVEVSRSSRTPDAVVLGPPFGITVDWWHRTDALKTWAGKQRPITIVRACQAAIQRSLEDILRDPLNFHTPLPSPHGKGRDTDPFGLDSRRMALATDIGFSPDALGASWEAYPVTELLAFVALQYFQPSEDEDHSDRAGGPRRMRYQTWHTPTPWAVACAVFCGSAWLPGTRRWKFIVSPRDDILKARYKGLTYSQEV